VFRRGREREHQGKEEERIGRRKEGGSGWSYPLAQSFGSGEDLLGESMTAGAPQSCFTVLRKTKEIFAKMPLVFEIFWKVKNYTSFGTIQHFVFV
jgi:hypothetical protein